MSTPESRAINENIGIGNKVSVYHLPTYTRYNVVTKPDGSRIFNPSSLSKLCATLAVANTDPYNVQRFVLIFKVYHYHLLLYFCFSVFEIIFKCFRN